MTREVVQIIDKETGDVNNLRDKKLADSTTQQQSGSASTDSVVMKTTGGDYVEIARDSFVGAIKSVMDDLIKGNKYTTLGANDPIAAFNSNALGGITPANLMSVLLGKGGSVSHPSANEKFDLNNLTTPGLWTTPSYTTNAPSAFFNTCLVFTTGSNYNGLFQVMFGMDQVGYFDPTIYYRRCYGGNWS